MRFLLFDVKPWPERVAQYLGTAAALRPRLDALGGCEFIDRFRRSDDSAWFLSFQIWRDEAALARWRCEPRHREAQAAGRREVFQDYRLRVGEVVREETPGRAALQASSIAPYARYVVLTDAIGNIAPPAQFASIYRDGASLRVQEAASFSAALDALEDCRIGGATVRAWIGVVDRDYGMHERAEAP